MLKIHSHHTTQERAVVMTMRDVLLSIRSIAKRLFCFARAISNEIKRTSDGDLVQGRPTSAKFALVAATNYAQTSHSRHRPPHPDIGHAEHPSPPSRVIPGHS